MANNIYSELFEQLPIPERLEPENIAKMLEENTQFSKKRSNIIVSEAVTSETKINKTTEVKAKKSHSAAYRAIMSVAACAVLVLGLVRYASVDSNTGLTDDNRGGSFAENYDELHKTFQKYYVNTDEKKNLDSALAEIEHSYNELENQGETDNVAPANDEPAVTLDSVEDIPMPPVTEEEPPVVEENNDVVIEDAPAVTPDEENVTIEDEAELVLPDVSGFGANDNIFMQGGKAFITEHDSIRLISAVNGELALGDVIAPECAQNESKALVNYFVSGDRLAVVYAAETYEAVLPEADEEAPAAEEETDKTVLDELMDDLYTEEVPSLVRHSVEIKLYDIANGKATLLATDVLSGRFVDVKQSGSAVYVVTSYDDYRLSPIVGVNDLESYVPSYTVNGEKIYIEASSILIPSYMSTTNYTVVAGVDMASAGVSVQALLGYEGKFLMTENAFYAFGYENANGIDKTTVSMFNLNSGVVSLGSYSSCEGVALSGDGITEIGGAVVISTLKNSPEGFVTTVTAFDSALNMVSKCELPAVLTTACNEDGVLVLTGKEDYAIDLRDPAAPLVVDPVINKEQSVDFVKYGEGYVALTDIDGTLTLSHFAFDDDGNAYTICDSAVYSGEYTSKALSDNTVLYVNNVLGIVGVPYGFYDGYDFCYRYALYTLDGSEFTLVGNIEIHEMDTAFEFGKAIEHDGVLYIFAEGRVYSAIAAYETLALVDSVSFVESTYSGHIAF
ncbi:MAG: beta-propeller domain-containing protein [Oscillospiraceae bacterium]|nr:beta-propeller domain-containing protein [Oscillospiraceae bacterium]MBQ8624530.1 beta-propeller domain-containing protein [Oscillospiraceae bacterium]